MIHENLNNKSSTRYPNFFLVGCPRCGTTWTNAALHEHPQVFVPEQKQIHFFDEHYDRGFEWYLSNFTPANTSHIAVGEISTDYSLPHAVKRLGLHFPDAKLMYAVRNPVERAYSFYQSRAPHKGWKSFEEALESEPELLQRGRYIEEIEGILELFPKKQLLVLFYDDLKGNDRAYLRSIFRYLSVDENHQSRLYGNPLRAAMFPTLRRRMRQAGLTPLVDAINKSFVGDGIRKALRKTRKRRTASIAPDTRAQLQDYYQNLNYQLANFTGRDLSHWK